MFQSFKVTGGSAAVPDRVDQVRAELSRRGIDAFMVPRGDEHRGEYVAQYAARLAWLTGFTGSAGLAIVGLNKAALFVDGRYTVQARSQVPGRLFSVHQIPNASPEEWLRETLGRASGANRAATIGFDPWLHSVGEIERLSAQFEDSELTFKAIAANPVDKAWGRARPARPLEPVIVQPLARAGMAPEDKIDTVQSALRKAGQDATVLTAPDSICWLLNVRGSDIAHNPVVLCFAIVPARGKVELFVEPEKISGETRAHLAGFTKLQAREKFGERLKALEQARKTVRVEPATCPVWIVSKLGGAKRIARGDDLCVLPKAIKNKVEIRGTRQAHKRDGAAVCRFLAWLDREAPGGRVDEIAAARYLEQMRAETGKLREISFDTISGSGPNGAIVHYRVTEPSNRKLAKGELYLVDSGAQYADGTTDITRTIAIGKPSEEMRDRFTRVLKGHIAIATAVFPAGTRGVDLDPLARRALWDAGLDFDHGTGHGVGSYLSVHEGPQSISKRGMTALQAGMIISNEPGYYKEGGYGIRIENLVLVAPAKMPTGGDRPMMSFETLTLAPIDRRLIVPNLLSAAERQWLNSYHRWVGDEIGPQLDGPDKAWLGQACKAI